MSWKTAKFTGAAEADLKKDEAIKDALFVDGVDVRGCMFWETVDSISVGKGVMSERYGLIYVDADDEGNGTYGRCIKDSYKYLQKVIAEKGKSL